MSRALRVANASLRSRANEHANAGGGTRTLTGFTQPDFESDPGPDSSPQKQANPAQSGDVVSATVRDDGESTPIDDVQELAEKLSKLTPEQREALRKLLD